MAQIPISQPCVTGDKDPAGGSFNFFAGGGEMGELMRTFDWESTSLGVPDAWPASLKTAVRLILTTNHPMFLWWGADLIQFYNDACRLVMGSEQHPSALGRPGRDSWKEIWHIIGPDIDLVMSGKGSRWYEELLIPVTRHGKQEDAWWTYGYSPIEDESGVQGVLTTFSDVTQAHVSRRNLEQSYRTLSNLMDEGFCILEVIFDPAGHPIDYRYIEANPAFEKHSGLTGAVGKTIRELVPDIEFHWIETYGRVAKTGDPIRFVENVASMGRWFDVYASHIGQSGSRKVAVVFKDITEQRRAEEELRIANERLHLAIEGAGEGIWDWNIPQKRFNYSERCKEIIGYAKGELANAQVGWKARIHPEDADHVRLTMREYLDGATTSFSCEYRVRCKFGTWKWVHSRGVLVERSPAGEPLHIVGIIGDITDRKKANERIWQLANLDALTGLPNRRLFRDRLRQAVLNAQQCGSAVALLFIDLDRFKQVNDLLGHDAGDILLVEAARRIEECVRESDTVARLGGDEFTIVLPDLFDLDPVERVAKKVLDALALPFAIGSESAFLSGSIGIAISPIDATKPEELIRKADQAMYAAKHAGKNQFSYFTSDMDEKAHMRLRLLHELRYAIDLNQIQINYQPVIDLRTGNLIKVEALARWEHPHFGNVSPSQFIPLAEEAGLITSIGDYVFREATSALKRWSSTFGVGFQLSINKSPVQFGAKEQVKWLEHIKQLNLPPGSIVIEITEGLLLDISDDVSNELLEYKNAGIQIAIDDFGTGYSSMAYLQRFDIDYLKIDQTFVKNMTVNAGDRAIAESMILMAHKLGLKVIAEGVETKEQMEILKAAGCDYGQGFLFSRPLAASKFEELLHDQMLAPIKALH